MDVSHRAGAGWIEVVTGSMFSGKSEELIRRLRRAQIAKRKVQIFKPAIDNRYSDTHITSHSAMQIHADSVGSARELLERVLPETEVVGIDEGQDYLGKPFEPMPQLLAIAEYITKTLAICMVCGAPANHTQRLVASHERVVVGGQGTYEARCRHCFDPRLGQ
jgi:thymidine kinase